MNRNLETEEWVAANSTYPKVAGQCEYEHLTRPKKSLQINT